MQQVEGSWNEVAANLREERLTEEQLEELRRELWDNHKDRAEARGWRVERIGIDVFRAYDHAELIDAIKFEIDDFNRDSSDGDPRYEIHAENMAGLLERVLQANGAEVPEVPEW